MKLRARIPRVIASTVETGPERAGPVLDGSDIVLPNVWKLPPHSVAIVGRPAVWVALGLTTPQLALGPLKVPGLNLRVEQDFGGHLLLIVVGAKAEEARIIEAGPLHPNGTGPLVPYRYPEDDIARHGELDFEPTLIPPPNGFSEHFFAELLLNAQRAYDGDQRYLALEVPFLRIGRDSNSYAVGVLLACGIDPRAIPKPQKSLRHEWTGYPGARDPVHRSNFGAFLGTHRELGDGVFAAAYHGSDGHPRYVAVGGAPNASVQLPDGSTATLDAHGRIVLAPEDARRRGLAIGHTQPPAQIRHRRRFPRDPSPAGAVITLIVDGQATALHPGNEYTGTIVARHDSLALATLRANGRDVVLPLTELGVELGDPERVDRLLHVGNGLTVGLHWDRSPKLIAHGEAALQEAEQALRALADPTGGGDPARARVLRGFVAGALGGLAGAGVKLACERMAEPRPPKRAAPQANLIRNLVQVGTSMLLGSAYGAVSEVAPVLRKGSGVPYGFGVWAARQTLALLPLRRSPNPGHQTVNERVREALGHGLWGLAVERVRAAVRARI